MKDGGPAFPTEHLDQRPHSGMTLRDWFAGMALTQIPREMPDVANIAHIAYNIADAMLTEKEQREREADQHGDQT